ncbi:permease [Escherichia coli]|uniref:Permease n=1 Tax=Escherichia coli TaxID=562 RepID=A0A376YGS2_ECOLX|nr:permease [Escherichia coli]
MFSCVAFFGTAFVNSLNWALVPDTVDYGEWKTGIRAEGSVYTGYTFFRKNFCRTCWLLARHYADANRLCSQHRAK